MIDSPFQVVGEIFLGIPLVTEHPRLIGKRVQGQCSMYFSNNWMSSEITIRRLTLFMTTCRRISSFHLFGETSSAILDTKTTTRDTNNIILCFVLQKPVQWREVIAWKYAHQYPI